MLSQSDTSRVLAKLAEQGRGDTLQFIRYVPLVAQRCARVVVQCQPALTTLLKSCEAISHIVDNESDPGDFDLQLPLLSLPQTHLISLQVGHGCEQVGLMAGQFLLNEPNRPGNPELDFCQTAPLIGKLDLVIAPNTSTCHFAGALAAQVWVPLSNSNDWRFLVDRDDSPWYPTMSLFRQSTRGDWSYVFASMATGLAARFSR